MSFAPPPLTVIGLMGRVTNAKGDFVGVKHAGKDTVATMIRQALEPFYECHTLSFAQPLKQMVCQMYGLGDPKDMEDCKEQTIMIHHGTSWTYRRLLEVIGTNVVRQRLGMESLWIEKLMEKISQLKAHPLDMMLGTIHHDIRDFDRDRLFKDLKTACEAEEIPMPSQKPIVILVTDVRMPLEYHSLRRFRHNHMLQVHRIMPNVPSPTDFHSSNQSYVDMIPDQVIENVSSLDDLEHHVQEFVQRVFSFPSCD